MDIAEKVLRLKDDFDDVYEAGRKKEYDAFWDAYQDKGNHTSYENAFSGKHWTDDNFKPKYNIIMSGDYGANASFRQSQMTDIKGILEKQNVVLDTSQAARFTNTFQNSKVTKAPSLNLTGCTLFSQVFYGCTNLTEVELCNLKANCTITGVFSLCKNLVSLKMINCTIGQNGFDVQYSNLSHDSLINDEGTGVLNSLEDKSGTGTVWTITLGSTNLAKLTDAEKAIATQKGWTLA